jgi:hypothetical protein
LAMIKAENLYFFSFFSMGLWSVFKANWFLFYLNYDNLISDIQEQFWVIFQAYIKHLSLSCVVLSRA